MSYRPFCDSLLQAISGSISGLIVCHWVASSYRCPRVSNVCSSLCRATNCRLKGKPFAENPHGKDKVGCPLKLNGAVKARNVSGEFTSSIFPSITYGAGPGAERQAITSTSSSTLSIYCLVLVRMAWHMRYCIVSNCFTQFQ